MHLDGTRTEPWSLPDRGCVFRSTNTDLEHERVYVALRDTAPEPAPETPRTLLRLMLASGAEYGGTTTEGTSR